MLDFEKKYCMYIKISIDIFGSYAIVNSCLFFNVLDCCSYDVIILSILLVVITFSISLFHFNAFGRRNLCFNFQDISNGKVWSVSFTFCTLIERVKGFGVKLNANMGMCGRLECFISFEGSIVSVLLPC